MSRAKMALALILVAIVILSALVYSSAAEHFWLSRSLIVKEDNVGVSSYYQPVFQFNITDSDKHLGDFYFRVEAIPPNQTSDTVYISFQHFGNTKLDSIDFHFSSPEVKRVYLDMSDPVGIKVSSSRDANSFSVKADNFGELGTLQGDIVYQFILSNDKTNSNNLYFSADISMHYMTPLQLTSLKAHLTISTVIPAE
jgi:hypothetical protein